jgi:hypothetical protein
MLALLTVVIGLVITLLISVWVWSDARRRRMAHGGLWAVGTFVLTIPVLPFYLAKRPLKSGEVREGGTAWNVTKFSVIFGTLWVIYVGLLALVGPRELDGYVLSSAEVAVAVGCLFGLWFVLAVGAVAVGLFLKKSSIVERGPTGPLCAWTGCTGADPLGEEAHMDCPHCGKSSPDGSRFCPHCGSALTQVPGAGQPTGAFPVQPADATLTGPAPTSGEAIASLVLGVAGLLCGVTAIPGLILGMRALRDIRSSGGRLGGKGLAVAGTVVSGVVLALMAVSIVVIIVLTALGSSVSTSMQEVANSLGNAP